MNALSGRFAGRLVRTVVGSMLGLTPVAVMAVSACAGDKAASREPEYTIIKNDSAPPEQRGLSTDKQAEVQMVLQQREATARKCYQDVLNERQDRSFAGSVEVLITLRPAGDPSARVLKSTLGSKEVEDCLVEKIAAFEFPVVEQEGEVPYTYMFRPAY